MLKKSFSTNFTDFEWKKYLEVARHFCNESELPELAFSRYEWSFVEHTTHEFCHAALLGLEINDLLDGAEVSWKVDKKIQKIDDRLYEREEQEVSALATEMIVLRDLGIPIKENEIIEAAMEQEVPKKFMQEALLQLEDYRQTADVVLEMLEEARRKYLDTHKY